MQANEEEEEPEIHELFETWESQVRHLHQFLNPPEAGAPPGQRLLHPDAPNQDPASGTTSWRRVQGTTVALSGSAQKQKLK
jgi:hypothetical protein